MMNKNSHIILWMLALAVIPAAELRAQSQGAQWPATSTARAEGADRVRVSLMADVEQAGRGDIFHLGVRFQMEPGWHIYWKNPGQAAIPTEITWKASAVEVGPLRWPAPGVFQQSHGFITTYGYETEVLLTAPATVSTQAPDILLIQADVEFLACKIDCVPGDATLQLSLPAAGTSIPASRSDIELFESWRKRVPAPAALAGLETAYSWSRETIQPGESIQGSIELIRCRTPGKDPGACPELSAPAGPAAKAFVPERTEGVEWTVTAVRPHPSAFRGVLIEVAGKAGLDPIPATVAWLAGVAKLEESGQPRLVEVRTSIPRQSAGAAQGLVQTAGVAEAPGSPAAGPPAPIREETPLSLWWVLLLAFAGGMVLNLMPCVLPVLAIKVYSFIELAHRDRKEIGKHTASYSLGIVSSMMALALAVILLQQAGTRIGWGFQFQQPVFLVVVSAVVFLFALNLFGVFEIRLDASGAGAAVDKTFGLRRSFGEGVLAVILATPCSAPFLGAAVGFALASSPPIILMVFVMIGLGLTAPFAAATLIPGVTRILPRPGAWMNRLKQFLGFAMMGTLVWLLWILGLSAGADGMAKTLAFLLALGLAAWTWGWPAIRFRAAFIALGLIATAGTAAVVFPLKMAGQKTPDHAAGDSLAWRPWSEAAVADALREGKPVFVDFTATWCITCKANENGVLASTSVVSAFRDNGFVLLKGDWTNEDETIRAKLAEFGKAGVPLYLVYSPARPTQPKVLPELLTNSIVLEAIAEARPTAQR
ncbi:MAG: Thiol:disulfide interchange protein DsbD [Myxococcota bacterium]|nr:Thiol:disulfide interchange protein DsbD [Myxococcota bacterium]